VLEVVNEVIVISHDQVVELLVFGEVQVVKVVVVVGVREVVELLVFGDLHVLAAVDGAAFVSTGVVVLLSASLVIRSVHVFDERAVGGGDTVEQFLARWVHGPRARRGRRRGGRALGGVCLQDVRASSAVCSHFDGAPRCSALNHHSGYRSSLCSA